jgi:hypothetical protein
MDRVNRHDGSHLAAGFRDAGAAAGAKMAKCLTASPMAFAKIEGSWPFQTYEAICLRLPFNGPFFSFSPFPVAGAIPQKSNGIQAS